MMAHRLISGTEGVRELWHADAKTRKNWEYLRPDMGVTVVKQDPDGTESARYEATVTVSPLPEPWYTVVAPWVLPTVIQGGLAITTGDTLHEYFSPDHPFNAFAVVSPQGQFRGWYANVTWTPVVELSAQGALLIWQDLILDLVVLPDGTQTNLDDNELDESHILRGAPDLRRAIHEARSFMKKLAAQASPPFRRPPVS